MISEGQSLDDFIVRNKVAERRKELGLTQEALAARIGVSRWTILRQEQEREDDDNLPSIKLALRLAEVLECPVAELYWLEPLPEEEDDED